MLDDAYLQHVLRVHARGHPPVLPGVLPASPDDGRAAVGVPRAARHETVGVLVARRAEEGVAQVELDYVTPRFRDFTPGEFVYRRSGLFLDRGYRQVLTPPGMVAPYYESLGFRRDGDHWALDL